MECRIFDEEEGLLLNDEEITNRIAMNLWTICKNRKISNLAQRVGEKIHKVVKDKDASLLSAKTIGKKVSQLRKLLQKKSSKFDDKLNIRRQIEKKCDKPDHEQNIEEHIEEEQGDMKNCLQLQQKFEKARDRANSLYMKNVCLARKLSRREHLLLKTPSGRKRHILNSPKKSPIKKRTDHMYVSRSPKKISEKQQKLIAQNDILECEKRQLKKRLTCVSTEKKFTERLCRELKKNLDFVQSKNAQLNKQVREMEISTNY